MARDTRQKASAPAAAKPEAELAHLLQFGTLDEAESTLRRLDALWRERRDARDAAGARRILDVAREGRRRAQMIAGNKKVSAAKRAEKEEIRRWFRGWLEAPGSFFDWLELRKHAPEFVTMFGKAESGESTDQE